ncbi:molybdopterin biosynthesis protein [archaeon SCG-AAA382B04]|nr:molybdopterin biosynthesis protein [archaeon SCG-AAA382B04]
MFYLTRIEFRDLISLEKAKKRIKNNIEVKSNEKRIEDCVGYTLAQDVFSDVDVPSFDRAGMDGYAVKASDTFGAEEDAPKELKKIGEVFPGETKNLSLKKGESIEVATGAVLPEGANAVVMIEYVNEFEEKIQVRKAVAPDDNVMYTGSDIMAGEKGLSEGDVLNARDIGVLAAIGKKNVKVFESPKIGVISIGKELVPPGKELRPGEIFDTNSFSIRSELAEIGINQNFYGIVGDNEEEIRSNVSKAISENDVVLTSGSTSAGSSDLLYNVLEDGEMLFHGVAIKPGKPTLATKFKDSLLIGLPGYPTSALTIYNLLVDPILREFIGADSRKKELDAITSTKIRSISGRRHFHPVGLVKRDESNYLYPINKGSGAITSLSQAEGFIEIKENEEYIEEGTTKSVVLFSEKIELPDILFMGSHSIGIDIIRKKLSGSSKSINIGSSGGLRLMKKGIPDISGIHLLNEEGEYNLPFLKEHNLSNAYLIKGYLREQGFFVEKGNPHEAHNISDLVTKDIKFINRNKGSGTRKLLDLKLKKLSEKKGVGVDEIKKKIKGYNISSKTHSGVASAVKIGKANIGIGTRYFAQDNGLDFIKLNEEEYDFLINKDSFEKETMKEFLEQLKSNEFSEKLEEVPGLRGYDKTGEIIELDF